eukprot:30604-Pelagococcus_subviridis.AAC.5
MERPAGALPPRAVVARARPKGERGVAAVLPRRRRRVVVPRARAQRQDAFAGERRAREGRGA